MENEKVKLLIVEDEPDICTTVQSYFGKRGFLVSTTGSGVEALSMIKASKPDVVVLDISLNDISGIEVLTELRRYDQQTRVIMMTGQKYPEEEIEKIKAIGLSGYYEKPFILEEVARLIYEVACFQSKGLTTISHKEKKPEPSGGDIVHKLSNLLGIIRGKCENFTSNVEDGIYKNKTQEELVNMSLEIMKDIEETVDKSMTIVEQIKEHRK